MLRVAVSARDGSARSQTPPRRTGATLWAVARLSTEQHSEPPALATGSHRSTTPPRRTGERGPHDRSVDSTNVLRAFGVPTEQAIVEPEPAATSEPDVRVGSVKVLPAEPEPAATNPEPGDANNNHIMIEMEQVAASTYSADTRSYYAWLLQGDMLGSKSRRVLESTGEFESRILPAMAAVWCELEQLLASGSTEADALVRTIREALAIMHVQIPRVRALSKSTLTVVRATKDRFLLGYLARQLGSCCEQALRGLRSPASDARAGDVDIGQQPKRESEGASQNQVASQDKRELEKTKKALETLASHIETELRDGIAFALGKEFGPLLTDILKLEHDLDALYDGGAVTVALADIEQSLGSIHSAMQRQATGLSNAQTTKADLTQLARKAFILASLAAALARLGTSRVGHTRSELEQCSPPPQLPLAPIFLAGRDEFVACLSSDANARLLAPLSHMMALEDELDRLLISEHGDQRVVDLTIDAVHTQIDRLQGVAQEGGLLEGVQAGLGLLALAQCLGSQISHGVGLLKARASSETQPELLWSGKHSALFAGFHKLLPDRHPLFSTFKSISTICASASGTSNSVDRSAGKGKMPPDADSHVDTFLAEYESVVMALKAPMVRAAAPCEVDTQYKPTTPGPGHSLLHTPVTTDHEPLLF